MPDADELQATAHIAAGEHCYSGRGAVHAGAPGPGRSGLMRIRRQHDLGIAEAKSRIEQVTADLEKRFSLQSEWQGDELCFRGSGVKGSVAVAEDSLEFDITLGFALMMLEPTIRSAINTALDKHIDRGK